MVNFSDQEAREIEQALILTRAEIEKLNRALAEKDALIGRLRAATWDENVRLLAESKEGLLQQYCNLQIMYGQQKHQIRDKDKEIADLKRAYTQELGRHKDTIHEIIVYQADLEAKYQQLMEKAILFAKATISDMITEGTVKKAQAFLKERKGA